MMEPYCFVEVVAPADCVSAVYTVLAKRRYGGFLFLCVCETSRVYIVRVVMIITDCKFQKKMCVCVCV